MMKIFILILAALLITGLPAKAETMSETVPVADRQLDSASTVADYLVYAARHNPGLQVAFERWQAALARISPAGTLPDPRFTYSHYLEEVETRVGPQRRSIALTQTFPWLGKLKSRRDAAARAADAAEQKYEAARLDLFARVKQAYYEYYYLARAVETAEENVQLLTYLEDVTLAAYSAGSGSFGEAIKAQIELGKTEDLRQSLLDQRGPVLARLNAELNRSPQADLPWPQAIDDATTEFTEKQLFTWLEESPLLKAADFAAESGKAQWSLAKKQWIPDLSLGFKIIETDPARMPGIEDSGKDPLAATFSVNIPLWWGKYRAEAKEKKAQYRAVLHQRNDLANRLAAQVSSALFGYRDAQRKIELYGQSLVPKAEQHLEVTQQAFTSGQASFLDLIDAQRTRLEFQLAFERARADRGQKQAELEKLIGRELPGPQSNDGGNR